VRLFASDVVADDAGMRPVDGFVPVTRIAPDPDRLQSLAVDPGRFDWSARRLQQCWPRLRLGERERGEGAGCGQPARLTASTNASAVWDTVASSPSTTLAAVTILLPTLALMEFVLSTVCPPASIVALTPTVSSARATSVSKGSKSIDISMPWELMVTSLHSSVTLLEVRS